MEINKTSVKIFESAVRYMRLQMLIARRKHSDAVVSGAQYQAQNIIVYETPYLISNSFETL